MTGSQGEGFSPGRDMVSFLSLLNEEVTPGHKGEAGTHMGLLLTVVTSTEEVKSS